jgi:sigma-B regulation protein RsbU (phosphoserine phosphatase)
LARTDVVWTVASVAVVTLVIALDLVASSLILIGLVVLGPLLASIALSSRRTAFIAVYATAAALLLGIPDDIFLKPDHLVREAVVASTGVLAIFATRQREQREETLRKMAYVAEVAQRAMLRPPPAVVAHMAFAARYVSASDETLVGGDLYETAYTPYGVRLIVGDVRGKGLDAVSFAAQVLGCFREEVFTADLDALTSKIDQRVTADMNEEDFVTAVLAEFPVVPTVRLVNCGHHPPLRLRAQAAPLVPSLPTLPLGLGPTPAAEEFEFLPGDRLLVFTDGLVEARSRDGTFFPLEEHLNALVGVPLEQAVEVLVTHLLDHVGGKLDDDMAVVIAERRQEREEKA